MAIVLGLLVGVALAFVIRRLIIQQFLAAVAEAKLARDMSEETLRHCRSTLLKIEHEWSLAFDNFVAVDIETTGVAKAKCRVIQIAIVTFRGGRRSSVWSTYLNPGVTIPESATKVNRITDDMVKSAPTFSDIRYDIQRKLDAAPLVAHNLKFDADFLIEEFARLRIPWEPNYGHCTMRWKPGPPVADPPREERTFYSKRYRKEITYKVRNTLPWKKLGEAMADCGIPAAGPMHDAVNDAIGCGEVFIHRATTSVALAARAVSIAQGRVTASEKTFESARRRQARVSRWIVSRPT